jgi:hypothetical protein
MLLIAASATARAETASPASPEKSLAELLGPVFAQASDRTVRILMGGTSIATFPYANNQVFVSQLKALYGDARADVMRMGFINGSWDLPVQGWYKQPYAGPSFVRLRGDSNSSPLTLTGYGSKIIVEYSREADGGVAQIAIDDAPSGTIDCGGAQALSVKTVLQAPAGLHRVTIQPPAGGHVYLERVTFEQNRPGIEVIDGTQAGSGLINVYTVFPRGGSSVPGIPAEPGVGLRSYFGRPDIDLVIWSGPVNDSGGDNVDFATWAARMDEVVEATRSRRALIEFNTTGNASTIQTYRPHGLRTGDLVKISGVQASTPSINGWQTVTVLSPTTFSVPVAVWLGGRDGMVVKSGCPLLLIAEMGGFFSMPAHPNHAAFLQRYEYFRQLGRDHAHVHTLDWHGATFDPDISRYAANYYTLGGPVVIDPATGAYSGDFIHPNETANRIALNLLCQSMSIPIPLETSAPSVENRIRKTSPVATGARVPFFDGTTRRGGAASGLGASVFAGQTYIGTLPLVFSEKTANLTNWNQQIAASALSDRFGKYMECLYDVAVPIFDQIPAGERVTVTALMKPLAPWYYFQLRSPSNGPGVMYYRDSILPGCATILYESEEPPIWVTFDYVRGENAAILVTGRLYSISVARTNGQPVSTDWREFPVGADLHTQPAGGVTNSTATLNATARSAGNGVLSVSFDIGTDPNVTESVFSLNAFVADDGQVAAVAQQLTGLLPDTTYYYRARAATAGNPLAQKAEILSFHTLPIF